MEFGFCQKTQHYDFIMASNYVIVSIKLCLDVANYEYIILCNFDEPIVSAFEVIGVPPKHPTPVAGNVTEFYAFFCFPFDKNQGADVSV